MREAPFDELHRSFQSDRGIGGQEKMDMVRHDYEFVELKDSAFAIAE
jgi:hypothetical protein